MWEVAEKPRDLKDNEDLIWRPRTSGKKRIITDFQNKMASDIKE